MADPMNILKARYITTMPDGSRWAVPVEVIARDRAAFYADREFDGDVERSLREDTAPLFNDCREEIADWASNNMNWGDVEKLAVKVSEPRTMGRDDFQLGWVNGKHRVDDSEVSGG